MKDKKQKYKQLAVFKDLISEYLEETKSLSEIELLHKMYFNVHGKKPDKSLDTKKISKMILVKLKYGKQMEEAKSFQKNKKKQFKWSYKFKTIFKKSRKGNMLLVWYLNPQGEIALPQLHKLFSGNMIIINNRPHEVDPRAFWRMGKYKCLIVKAIDRRPVTNLDLNSIKERGDATDADELLIKAALHAVYVDGKEKKQLNPKNILIIVGVVIAAIVAYVLISGGVS